MTAPVSRLRKGLNFGTQDPATVVASESRVASPFQIQKHKKEAAKNWDTFYRNNGKVAFKDRMWTTREFSALGRLEEETDKGKGKLTYLMEVGCGTGAFVYPLLEKFPTTRFYAFDFSKKAVELVKTHERYTTDRVHTFVHDLTSTSEVLLEQMSSAEFSSTTGGDDSPAQASTSQLPSVISIIFVLSALPPSNHQAAIQSLFDVLAPGGSIIFRDYGLHDQAQLRFHNLPSKGYAETPSLLSAPSSTTDDTSDVGKPWYRRGDSTGTYFFTIEEMEGRMSSCSGGGYKLEGSATMVERVMENRAEAWNCTRRFVQGSWTKVPLVM